jgi:hypothetical protein
VQCGKLPKTFRKQHRIDGKADSSKLLEYFTRNQMEVLLSMPLLDLTLRKHGEGRFIQ